MTLRFPSLALLAAAFALLAGPALARCSQNVVERWAGRAGRLARRPAVRAARRGLAEPRGHHLRRPFQLPDRHAAGRAGDHRLQRRQRLRPPSRHRHHEQRALARISPTIRRTASPMCCAAGRASPARARPSTTSRSRTCGCGTCRPTPATGAPARRASTATRSSSMPIGDLCIAHLGHLHHRLTKEHLDELGRIDVLMVPIDGSFTMGVPLMADVIKSDRAQDRAADALLGPLPGSTASWA